MSTSAAPVVPVVPTTIDIYALPADPSSISVEIASDGSATIHLKAGVPILHVAFQKPGGWDSMNRVQRFRQASASVSTLSSQILESLKARVGL